MIARPDPSFFFSYLKDYCLNPPSDNEGQNLKKDMYEAKKTLEALLKCRNDVQAGNVAPTFGACGFHGPASGKAGQGCLPGKFKSSYALFTCNDLELDYKLNAERNKIAFGDLDRNLLNYIFNGDRVAKNMFLKRLDAEIMFHVIFFGRLAQKL